ncbi:hypothetical protein K6T82_08380 [Flavobacterium sp. 17A]|uniref:DUF4878 domain-containing protein n=1 Tax=Flavobacterium potami TaxID=2872310 RepID=A0A9X1KPT1_9FLAO|nr:hypothetical protein [Flavobacterium potami]MBZ4034780.1 hypothetical protein [Flavobacterium potami]
MKYLISFIVVLALFTNCKSREEDQSPDDINTTKEIKSPKETVQAYLAATNHFDFKAAKEFLIPNKPNLMLLETIKKMEKSLPDDRKSAFLDKEKEASYFEKEVTDSTAQIIVTPNKEATSQIKFKLLKVKSNWLIESVVSH